MAIYNVDAASFSNQAASESAATAVTEGGGDVIPKGRLLGLRATLTDNTAGNGDSITIKVYKDSTLTVAGGGEELYSGDFGFGSDEETLSDLLASPVPIFEQPYITITPGETGTDMSVTLYIDDGR